MYRRPFCYDLQIDGKPVLLPDADITIEYTDIDTNESGRDESYVMHRIVARYGVKKFPLPYDILSREEYLYMESLFRGKKEFTVTYRDHDGHVDKFIAYRSNHSITIHNARTGQYKNYKFNIIEC